jgi:cob(I)alamin adenosyltransferase
MLGVGRIIVYTGDGKGKTTAALGQAVRASGHGHSTLFVEFLESTWDYGEFEALEAFPNIEVARTSGTPVSTDAGPADPRQLALAAWRVAEEAAMTDQYDLLVLDELNYAVAEGYVSVVDVLAMLAMKPQRLSVVITGRAAPAELMEIADTVTEMRCVKHAFAQGVPARRGIEY